MTLSVAAFAVTTGAMRLYAGSAAARKDDSLSAKLAYFEANKDRYTSLFIGNSRLYRGLNPAVFDQVITTAGEPSNSFNFGIPAMTAAEINKVVRRVAAADPCCLKYVVVELWSPSHLVSVRADRTMASYDPITAWFALQHTIGSDRELDQKVLMSAEIVAAAGLNSVNVGSLLHKLPEYEPGLVIEGEEGDTYNGYAPLESEESSEFLKRREKFVAAGERAFREIVESQRQAYENRPALAPYQLESIALLESYMARLGDEVELIYVVSPFGKSYQAHPNVVPIFDYNDVSNYPELFDMSLWFDEGHLTAEGAEWMTRDLAQKILELSD